MAEEDFARQSITRVTRLPMVHQIDNCRLGGIIYLHHEVHQNGICQHHPLLCA
jgi:hypothetical protein